MYYKNIYMAKILYALLALVAMTSCAGSYNVQGSSNVPTLDGRMLFLKSYSGNELKSIDSCDIIHGQFTFTGSLDSTQIVTLFMDDESLMPLVLEDGKIQINIDNARQKVSGTPLNDKLFDFIEKYNRIENEMGELGHMQSQAIMNGHDMDKVNAELAAKAEQIAEREDKLVTGFIIENFDNVLGPGVFFMITAGNRYPELTPWIEDIMSKATDYFKNDAYVKDYYSKALQNQAIMNGTAMPDGSVEPSYTTPTPNELAQPGDMSADTVR